MTENRTQTGGGSRTRTRLRSIVARWVALVAGTGVLLLCGRGPLAGPSLRRPDDVGRWARSRPPDVVAMVALREMALLAGFYLLAVVTVALAGTLLGHRPTLDAARRLSPAGLRPLLALATSATVVVAMTGASGNADAAGRPSPAPTIRRVGTPPASASAPPALRRVDPARPKVATPTDPAPTDPAPTDPAPTDPAATVPTVGPSPSTSLRGSPPSTSPSSRQTPVPTVGAAPSAEPSTDPGAPSTRTSRPGRGADRAVPHRRKRTQDRARRVVTPETGATGRTAVEAYVVRPGDSFWSIAATRLTRDGNGGVPDGNAVARYWVRVVDANRNHLPVPGLPDLLFPGDRIVLPPV